MPAKSESTNRLSGLSGVRPQDAEPRAPLECITQAILSLAQALKG